MTTDPLWAALARPEAYPDDPSAAAGVEWIQTHLSHVYRTRERVYKFRKPVSLGFVDFSERAERNADCLREVTLNRRMAPDVYLGVAPLAGSAAAPRVGAAAEALAAADVEHCVVMRHLADGLDALSLLEAGRLAPEQIDALADVVARFHAAHGLGRPAPFTAADWHARCTEPSEANFATLAEAGAEDAKLAPPELLEAAAGRARAFARDHADRFERRRADGRAVDGHGDLHLQHVYFEGDDALPFAIDCLEFQERLRQIDAAAEVAFPAMDLRYRGHAALAERFLARYARESDDFDLYAVVDYFVAYRAGVRAKVASLAARDDAIGAEQRHGAAESTRRHLALAAEALAPRAPAALVLTAGVVGSGKSTVAAALAERTGGVVIASDRVRKALAGMAPTERGEGGWDEGLYAPEQVARAYAGLLERARPVLASGRVAILDATFSLRTRRAEARALAESLGCSFTVVEARCGETESKRRLAARAAEGRDPSDAGPELWDRSVAAFEPIAPDEGAHHVVETDDPAWRGTLTEGTVLFPDES